MSTVIYLNGDIYTMNPAQPKAQAMAIASANGAIIAVGTNDEVRRAGGQHKELVDLRGKTMVPGFTDAHIHLVSAAYRAHYIDAGNSTSEDAVAELVRQRAAQTPPGCWILGGQWDKNLWPDQQFPGKVSLDAAAPLHPVALWSKDGHLLWVNSLALQRANINDQTPDLANGAILRDGSGEPTGILQEHEAMNLVYSVTDQSDPALTRELVQGILPELRKSGITTIHDIEGLDTLHLFQQLHDEGTLDMRVNMILPRQLLPALRDRRIQIAPGDTMLRVGGIKIFADGTLGSQTAAMLEGFEDNPTNYGILAVPEEEMNEIVRTSAELGLSIAIHAIGDRAAHVALNAIEYAQRYLAESAAMAPGTAQVRYRLEHVQLITPDDLRRMRRLGVIASVQPFHAVADRDIAQRYWGKRARHAYAYRTMQHMGIPLALGSDAPVELFDPLRIIYAATVRSADATRRPPWQPHQSLTIQEALWDYTMGAAYAGTEEQYKGSLAV
ncbi:MAG TPA: amidohydrolase, partial [Ktedonobacteraceae bacterium]|nr:amidohydrolase [Ktedonobacteraceae bacterium]